MQQLLSKVAVADMIGLHPESVMRLARQGRFPKPLKTGPGDGCSVRFVAAEVERWIAERMAAREAASS